MRLPLIPLAAAALQLGLPSATLHAQDHQHGAVMDHAPTGAMPTQGGQAAFAAIQEIARLLQADPKTDWATVDLERLRRHLIDMELVTMQSRVTTVAIAEGAVFTVRGTPAVAAAIKRMTAAHVQMVEMEGGPRVVRTVHADGVRLVVTARTPGDLRAAAMIRGLGFIGLMTSGDHHQMHHLMIARGDPMMSHGH